ncbi:class I SAM-dependent methyltransferase [Kitasatospora sp. NPDC051170]|uniref:class I SAM-dependent methyltransferase n=1 Tax=Kitasatospora sp. NPDC051170 TaxID=3364056 RepID=UPI00378A141C
METTAGPSPLPLDYRGAHGLSEEGWLAMEARCERHDIALVVEALAGNHRVLEVGGGTGALARAVAGRLGAVTAVEPHPARAAAMRPLAEHGVTVLPGWAEELPLGDGEFDAAVGAWLLHYTDDPDMAVTEMARTVDASHPEAKVVLVQGAPDNELIALWNRACAPLLGEPEDHQGYLLGRAVHLLAEHGFAEVSSTRARVDVVFPEEGAEAKARAAAEALAGYWNPGHPRLAALREALLPPLREHFATGTDRIGDDAVVLVARPRRTA